MEDKRDPIFDRIELNKEEQPLFDALKECNNALKKGVKRLDSESKEFKEWNNFLDRGGSLSYDLYKKLTARGIEVKFDSHCLQNRSESIKGGPELKEFHRHFDVIEDLVRFIEYQHAHDEIGDVTLGIECGFSIFIRHRSTEDCEGQAVGRLQRNSSGWRTQYWEKTVKNDDKRCSGLIANMIQIDGVSIPCDLGDYFEKIWEDAAEGYLTQGDLKIRLQDLMDWITEIERSKPKWAC